MYDGKKTERIWLPRKLCVDPFMACRLRDRAAKNCRKLEDEIRWLIVKALDYEDSQDGKGRRLPFGGMRD
jgi:hypothetical protein